jgi:flagellar biogenesis protein FliO
MFKIFFTFFLWALLPLIGGEEESSSPITLMSSIQPIEPQNPTAETPSEAPLKHPATESSLKNNEEPPHLESATKSYESAFTKMIFSLVAILVFVFVVFYLFKKFSSSRIRQSNHFRTIKLLEKRAISPKSMLYLVEIGGRKILLAESQLEIRNVSNLEWIEAEKKGL